MSATYTRISDLFSRRKYRKSVPVIILTFISLVLFTRVLLRNYADVDIMPAWGPAPELPNDEPATDIRIPRVGANRKYVNGMFKHRMHKVFRSEVLDEPKTDEAPKEKK